MLYLSNTNPLIYRLCCSQANPLQGLCKSHFLPIIGTDLERRNSEGITDLNIQDKRIVISRLHFKFQKNRILIPLCNSSPSTLQVVVTLFVTAVIHFNTLVTHSSPRYGILHSQSMIYKQISIVTIFPIRKGDE